MSIGRVITKLSVRGSGIGKILMEESIARCYDIFGKRAIRIGAQCYAQKFYSQLGFVADGEVYDEDGIPHIEMVKQYDAKLRGFEDKPFASRGTSFLFVVTLSDLSQNYDLQKNKRLKLIRFTPKHYKALRKVARNSCWVAHSRCFIAPESTATRKTWIFFYHQTDYPKILKHFAEKGYQTEITDIRWLAKAIKGDYFIDIIFDTVNNICTVDDSWFDHAAKGSFADRPVLFLPAEELLWCKVYVQNRERFDGASESPDSKSRPREHGLEASIKKT